MRLSGLTCSIASGEALAWKLGYSVRLHRGSIEEEDAKMTHQRFLVTRPTHAPR